MTNQEVSLIDHFYNNPQPVADSGLKAFREKAYHSFNEMGIPGSRHEEWKYTRIASLFNKKYAVGDSSTPDSSMVDSIKLPGHETVNTLVFFNGKFLPELSRVISPELEVDSLDSAVVGEHKEIVQTYLGDSAHYVKDGVNALNTAFAPGGIFIRVAQSQTVSHPVYIYSINDARSAAIFAQPRTLVHLGRNAQVQIVETFKTLGVGESFTNQVIEIIVEKDARLEYYKIQEDAAQANQVSTTHIRQVETSLVHTVVLSLSGGMIRNNLNVIMAAPHSEAHLYGLYFLENSTHVDNHTLVDNVQPHCYSNQLYKGIISDQATGVFNGKIFVRQLAQKTNAYQSNKNILLSPVATINAKPQLEIFADDVKCSHGCTVGQLDEEAMFYMRARGIPEETAISMLVHAYALDVLEHIRLPEIRNYIDGLITISLDQKHS